MLEIEGKDKYKHYKGGVYYKLAETVIGDDYREYNPDVEAIGEATFESTGESMILLLNKRTKEIVPCFKDRDRDAESEFIEDVVIYQSEKDNKLWVRFTEVFEGYVFNDINDKSIKRFTKID